MVKFNIEQWIKAHDEVLKKNQEEFSEIKHKMTQIEGIKTDISWLKKFSAIQTIILTGVLLKLLIGG